MNNQLFNNFLKTSLLVVGGFIAFFLYQINIKLTYSRYSIQQDGTYLTVLDKQDGSVYTHFWGSWYTPSKYAKDSVNLNNSQFKGFYQSTKNPFLKN